MPVVGFLNSGSSEWFEHLTTAFRRGLAEKGYIGNFYPEDVLMSVRGRREWIEPLSRPPANDPGRDGTSARRSG